MSRWTHSNKAIFNIGYHLIWCPKYRRKVLVGEVEARLREIIIEAKCIYNNCNNIVNKTFRMLKDNGCYCKSCQKIVSQEKAKQTNLEKYGVVLHFD